MGAVLSCGLPPLRAGGLRSGALPGLQGVRGQWTGSWQAYGGGGGPTNVDFGLKGTTWQWGDYGLDQAGCPPQYHRTSSRAILHSNGMPSVHAEYSGYIIVCYRLS